MAELPTDDDHTEAIRRFITGLNQGCDAHQLVTDIGDLHITHNTFPGEVFMELAADMLEIANVEPANPIDHESLLKTHLPEVTFRGKENRRIQYTLLTAFALRGGLQPDLLEEVTYWIESYWWYSLFAAVAITRAAAEHKNLSVPTLLAQLAVKHDIQLP